MKERNFHYNVIFRSEPEGGFTVIVPALPGCISYGRNLEEAKFMALDAIRGYIASLKKHKEPIPSDKETFFCHSRVRESFKKTFFGLCLKFPVILQNNY